jgi:hypothetical protein
VRYEEALEALAGTGDERQIAQTLSDFGRVATKRGEWSAAHIRFATALQLARGLGARREAAYALEGVAELASRRGEPAMSGSLLGATEALREALGSPATAAEAKEKAASLEQLRAEMGDESLARELAAGHTMSYEMAVEHALQWLEGTPDSSE